MKQPFIAAPLYETIFILLPSFLVIGLILLLGDSFEWLSENETWTWLVIVVFIDVAHVYATFFRTYFDKAYFYSRWKLFVFLPLGLLVISFAIYYFFGYLLFWRLLAYLAVFHFIRQQYGFFMIYSGKIVSKIERGIGKLAIYSATVYPIIHWHCSEHKNFDWFIQGDFYQIHLPWLDSLFFSIYVLILSLYFFLEIKRSWNTKAINLPKNLILIGTGLSWYLGIVYFNNDILFTILNIVSHGVPYIFFVFLFGYRNYRHRNDTFLKYVFQPWGVLVFLLLLWLFAYTEEGLWDTFVWHEHAEAFPIFKDWQIDLNHLGTILITCLLTLPQLTHYLLDGFIWKRNSDNHWLKNVE